MPLPHPTRRLAGAPPEPASPLEAMVQVPGGAFLMGSNDFYPEERPVRRVTVETFWIDAYPVTNAEFARFVEATGHVTVAERAPDPADYPGIDPSLLVPGSLVFRQPRRPVPLHDPRAWWTYLPGASWRAPEGPGSTVEGRDDHPVVHVAWEDAAAYAAWAGKALPTEAEWEFAARGGLEGATYVWGDEFMPRGRRLANSWQGEFPWRPLGPDGRVGTSPVGSFPPNGYGLYDMAGNVWEWTADLFTPHSAPGPAPDPASAAVKPCCAPGPGRLPRDANRPPRGTNRPPPDAHTQPPDAHIPRRVVKGGSYLCAPEYCLRYRPAARQPESIDSSTGHIGFRCVRR